MQVLRPHPSPVPELVRMSSRPGSEKLSDAQVSFSELPDALGIGNIPRTDSFVYFGTSRATSGSSRCSNIFNGREKGKKLIELFPDFEIGLSKSWW